MKYFFQFILIFLTGCSPLQIKDYKYLNQGLVYLPKHIYDDEGNDKGWQPVLKLYPGMVLRVASIDAQSKNEEIKNKFQLLQPGISSFDWIIPGYLQLSSNGELKSNIDRFTREDLLILRFLTMVAIETSNVSPWIENDVKPISSDCQKLSGSYYGASIGFARSLDRILDRVICDAASESRSKKIGNTNEFESSVERNIEFENLLSKKILKPMISDLAINYLAATLSDGKYEPKPPESAKNENSIDAPTARRLICQGSLDQFTSGGYDASNEAYLEFSLPGSFFPDTKKRTFAVFGRDGWYFNDSFGEDGNYNGNDLKRLIKEKDPVVFSDWLPSNVKVRRSVFSALLPISIDQGGELPLAPPCMSILDLEKQLAPPNHSAHPKITGFLRQNIYVNLKGAASDEKINDALKNSSLSDGSIEFTFDSSYALNSGSSIVLLDKDSSATKANLLIAPGDIFILDRPLNQMPLRFY